MRPEIYTATEAVANTINLDVNWELPSCYVAVRYYDADPALGAANEVTPGAGTVTVTAKLVNHGKFVDITDGVFNCTIVNSFASYKGNASSIKAVPSGVTNATHYSVTVSQNAQ